MDRVILWENCKRWAYILPPLLTPPPLITSSLVSSVPPPAGWSQKQPPCPWFRLKKQVKIALTPRGFSFLLCLEAMESQGEVLNGVLPSLQRRHISWPNPSIPPPHSTDSSSGRWRFVTVYQSQTLVWKKVPCSRGKDALCFFYYCEIISVPHFLHR